MDTATGAAIGGHMVRGAGQSAPLMAPLELDVAQACLLSAVHALRAVTEHLPIAQRSPSCADLAVSDGSRLSILPTGRIPIPRKSSILCKSPPEHRQGIAHADVLHCPVMLSITGHSRSNGIRILESDTGSSKDSTRWAEAVRLYSQKHGPCGPRPAVHQTGGLIRMILGKKAARS